MTSEIHGALGKGLIGLTNFDDEHTISSILAHGAAADIWLINTPESDSPMVSKKIRLSKKVIGRNCGLRSTVDANVLWRQFKEDIQLRALRWSALRHRNVVRVFELREDLDLRVEYCPNGTVPHFLKQSQSDNVALRRNIISDVSQGVAYLHAQRPPIVHGSLNMNKLFVDKYGVTKVGEFGLAALTQHVAFLVPSISQGELYRWMSPELIQPDLNNNFCATPESDVWGLGCTIFEIISGRLPYPDQKHELRVCADIIDEKLPGNRDLCLSTELYDVWEILKYCWSFKPATRWTAQQLARAVYQASSTSSYDYM